MGVIGVRWCDFERIFFDDEYQKILKGILKLLFYLFFFIGSKGVLNNLISSYFWLFELVN